MDAFEAVMTLKRTNAVRDNLVNSLKWMGYDQYHRIYIKIMFFLRHDSWKLANCLHQLNLAVIHDCKTDLIAAHLSKQENTSESVQP